MLPVSYSPPMLLALFSTLMRANATGAGRLFSTHSSAELLPAVSALRPVPNLHLSTTTTGLPLTSATAHAGSGLLIVTGELETHGNTSFQGIILVLGRGRVSRKGGGNGLIQGAMMVAKFDPNGAAGTGFGGPSFSINGGGNSTVAYDSAWIRRALDTLGISIAGSSRIPLIQL